MEGFGKGTGLIAALHILALWAVAVAQPIYDLIGRNPAFLTAHQMQRGEIYLFVVVLSLAAPLLFLALPVLFVDKIRPGAGRMIAACVIAMLCFALLLPPIKLLDESTRRFVGIAGLALSAAIGAGYVRSTSLRAFLGFCIPGILAIPALFLMRDEVGTVLTPASEQTLSAAAPLTSPVPTVVVVLDELPLLSLLSAEGEIDARRFPAFASLSKEAHWFLNATAVSDDTTKAVPAIMTGRIFRVRQGLPRESTSSNIFTIAGPSMDMQVHEVVTQLCPNRYCTKRRGKTWGWHKVLWADVGIVFLHRVLPLGLSNKLPPISQTWSNFAGFENETAGSEADVSLLPPKAAFERFIHKIGEWSASPRPTLAFLHLIFPHPPWRYLPDGTDYAPPNVGHIDGLLDEGFWSDDTDSVAQAYLRHLLQLQLADRLLGDLIREMKSRGVYEQSLVIVTSDHGTSFKPGGSRRTLTRDNAAELAYVPLFIKKPGQKEGAKDFRLAQTIDIAPTMAGIWGGSFTHPVDGKDLFADGSELREEIFFDERKESLSRLAIASLPLSQGFALKQMLMGHIERVSKGWDDFGSSGKHEVAPEAGRAAPCRAWIEQPEQYESISRSSPRLPILMRGRISCEVSPSGRSHLIVALNGRLAGEKLMPDGADGHRFTFLVSPRLLRDGHNQIAFFLRQPNDSISSIVYERGADFSLVRDAAGGEMLVTAAGRRTAVVPGSIRGNIDHLQDLPGDEFLIQGWAADPETAPDPVMLLFFCEGRYILSGTTLSPRRDVAAALGDTKFTASGFIYQLSKAHCELGDNPHKLRIFALSGEKASELRWPRRDVTP